MEGRRVCDPQTVFLHTDIISAENSRTMHWCAFDKRWDVHQEGRSGERHCRSSQGTSSPPLQLRPGDTIDVLGGVAINTIDSREQVKGTGRPPRDIPKIQDGFASPGISLIAERLLYLRKARYTKTAAQVASASSRYCITGCSSELCHGEGQGELRSLYTDLRSPHS